MRRYFVLAVRDDGGWEVRYDSSRKLARRAETLCRTRGTDLWTLANKAKIPKKTPRWKSGEKSAAALRALQVFHEVAFIAPADSNDLSALFDFRLQAEKHGLAQEAEHLIQEILGENALASVKRLMREAVGCRLFYDNAAAE